jgi:hypothetical protein
MLRTQQLPCVVQFCSRQKLASALNAERIRAEIIHSVQIGNGSSSPSKASPVVQCRRIEQSLDSPPLRRRIQRSPAVPRVSYVVQSSNTPHWRSITKNGLLHPLSDNNSLYHCLILNMCGCIHVSHCFLNSAVANTCWRSCCYGAIA